MMNKMNFNKSNSFKNKVQSMSGKEIVQAMIDGLLENSDRVDMGSFGFFENDVCFGCAAHQTICRISGKEFESKNLSSTHEVWAVMLNENNDFIENFETAIDYLRRGRVEEYNKWASIIGVATLPLPELQNPSFELPCLDNYNWKEDLIHYQNFANNLQ